MAVPDITFPRSRLSSELQLGKAAEHLVCADLILQGHSAFLADQGLPYDVVVDLNGQLKRIQVKGAHIRYIKPQKSSPVEVYRYSLRRAKKGDRPIGAHECDYFAFVALDRKLIAYVPIADLIRAGKVIQCVEFRTRAISYPVRHKRTNASMEIKNSGGKYFEDLSLFR
jgi:PD-(D/E)XK nuclease superfamily protein